MRSVLNWIMRRCGSKSEVISLENMTEDPE